MSAKSKAKKAELMPSKRSAAMQASPIRRLVPLADQAKATGTKVYHLNIGQPDIITPKEIMDAIRNFREEVLAYGPSLGLLELRQEIKRYFEKLDIILSVDDVMVTTAGSEAIVFALMAVGDPGDEVLVPEPFYTNYNGFASMADIKLVAVPTDVEDGFGMPSKAEFAKRITREDQGHPVLLAQQPHRGGLFPLRSGDAGRAGQREEPLAAGRRGLPRGSFTTAATTPASCTSRGRGPGHHAGLRLQALFGLRGQGGLPGQPQPPHHAGRA